MAEQTLVTEEEALTRNELLTLLIEECAEIIQAVTKCQRFGFDRKQRGYGHNDIVLAGEIGDLLGVVDGLRDHLDQLEIYTKRGTKLARALQAKRMFGLAGSNSP